MIWKKRIAESGSKGYRHLLRTGGCDPLTAHYAYRLLRSTASIVVLSAIVPVLIALSFAVPVLAVGKPSSPPLGLSREEALRLGEVMYQDGILPSGEPVQAVVEGDIPVEGSMFSCAHCHMRSGLGSIEGTIITPPTSGEKLFKPYKSGHEFTEYQRQHLPAYLQPPDIRPAYTDKTLAEALQTGVDPGGRKLDLIMPRYLLGDKDMDILVYYLRNLSSKPSPGVMAKTIRFATVISEGVSSTDRDSMLLPLQAYVRDRQALSAYFAARARRELFAEEMDLARRSFELETWLLKGPPRTWRKQLDAYYKKAPVFALLGGIVKGNWAPVHEFCEQNRIPAIFPVTDQPVISDTDWYTLYFSKGPYQEGEAAANYLKNKAGPVVQVYRATAVGNSLARGFRETRRKIGVPDADEIVFRSDEKIGDDLVRKLAGRYGNGVILLWLGMDDFSWLAGAVADHGPITVFASSTVLGEKFSELPEKVRLHAYFTYPYRFPEDRSGAMHVVRPWLKIKGIPEKNLSISSRMYFIGRVLTDTFMHMQRHYYRDHFLDVIDMLEDESHTIADYPRLSFGPGQRYASKGCYIVQLSAGEKPEILRKSDWVVH